VEGLPMTAHPTADAIWSHLSSDLRGFIRRKVSDDHVADDLLQETFLRVHRNVGTLAEVDRVAAWVYRIARNVIHDHHRKSNGSASLPPEFEPAEPEEDRSSRLRCLSASWLNEMVRSLPEAYRDAIQLAEVEGLSQQEVGARLGLSLSGAKSRIQRGRAMLRDSLEKCCRFEFDRRGNMIDYEQKRDSRACRDCDV
jgi:RNA polymerase sigma-70 factor, ECF subfamily